MTESPPATTARPRPAPKPGFLPTILASVACFLVVFEFLVFQLQAGRDPALGAPAPPVAKSSARPTVVNRKLIKRRVVVDAARPARSASSGATSTVSLAPAAPVAATPAPAPAPAPVAATPVTSSS